MGVWSTQLMSEPRYLEGDEAALNTEPETDNDDDDSGLPDRMWEDE